MTREQEILDFLETNLIKPVLQSPNTSERFKKATRGLRLRLKQRDAQGMIRYFWNTVADTNAKHANYGRMFKNEGYPDFDNVVEKFRIRFKEI